MEKNRTTLIDSIGGFSNHLYIRGKANSTAEAYLTDAKQFTNFLKITMNNKIRYIDKITLIETETYKKYLMENLKEKKMAKQTVLRKYNSVKVYCQYLESEYGVSDITKGDKFGNKNYIRDWNLNSYDKSDEIKIFEDYEIDKMFDTLYKEKNDKNIFRDIAIIEVLHSTGMRRSEILELKWNDISFFKKEILIRRKKTINASTVKLTSNAINALSVLHSQSNLAESEFIFRGVKKNSINLSKNAYTEIINKWIEKSGVNPKATGHWFRHTFITTCMRNGIPSEKICKFTGHKNVNSLKAYEHLVSTDTEDVANLFERNQRIA